MGFWLKRLSLLFNSTLLCQQIGNIVLRQPISIFNSDAFFDKRTIINATSSNEFMSDLQETIISPNTLNSA